MRGFFQALLALFLLWLFCLLLEAAYVGWHAAHPAAPIQGTPTAEPTRAAASCQNSDPPTSSPYLAEARASAARQGVEPLVFAWQIWQESNYHPDALSPAGAEGIAQFMPETARGMGIDPWNPTQALEAAARLDAAHLTQFAEAAQQLAAQYGGNEARYAYGLALSAYNAGPGATQGAWNQAYTNGTRWPDSGPWTWLTLLAGETQRYVPNILGC